MFFLLSTIILSSRVSFILLNLLFKSQLVATAGQGQGFDIDLIKLISDAVTIPVIASSGAGTAEHFSEVFQKTSASAALAAGIFHRKEVRTFTENSGSNLIFCRTENMIILYRNDGNMFHVPGFVSCIPS